MGGTLFSLHLVTTLAGSSTENAPSREATTASAAMAATCIHILQVCRIVLVAAAMVSCALRRSCSHTCRTSTCAPPALTWGLSEGPDAKQWADRSQHRLSVWLQVYVSVGRGQHGRLCVGVAGNIQGTFSQACLVSASVHRSLAHN